MCIGVYECVWVCMGVYGCVWVCIGLYRVNRVYIGCFGCKDGSAFTTPFFELASSAMRSCVCFTRCLARTLCNNAGV